MGRTTARLVSVLARLSASETGVLVGGLTAGKALPSEVMNRIVERTDGIPLFVEELTKTLIESGLLREENESYGAGRPAAGDGHSSESLHASLMERLDRFAPAKELAQIGAALGGNFRTNFWLPWLAVPTINCAPRSGRLDAGLMFQRGEPPRATFTFKHALVSGCCLRHAVAQSAPGSCMRELVARWRSDFPMSARRSRRSWRIISHRPFSQIQRLNTGERPANGRYSGQRMRRPSRI